MPQASYKCTLRSHICMREHESRYLCEIAAKLGNASSCCFLEDYKDVRRSMGYFKKWKTAHLWKDIHTVLGLTIQTVDLCLIVFSKHMQNIEKDTVNSSFNSNWFHSLLLKTENFGWKTKKKKKFALKIVFIWDSKPHLRGQVTLHYFLCSNDVLFKCFPTNIFAW